MSDQAAGRPSGDAGAGRLLAWWARSGAEVPLAESMACSKDGCSKSTVSPFDLYCRQGEADQNDFHFIVLGSNRRLQVFAIYAARALFGLLAVIAASSSSRIPLDVAAALAGVLILVPPLRLFQTSRIVAPIAWLCLFTLVVAAYEQWMSAADDRDALAVIMVAAVAALVAAVAAYRDAGVDSTRSHESVHRGVAIALSVVIGSALLFALFGFGIGTLGEAVHRVLLLVCLAAIGGVVGGAAISGFILGVRHVKVDDVERREPKPFEGWRPWSRRELPASPSSKKRITAQVELMVYIAYVAVTRVINRFIDTANLAKRMICRAINTLKRTIWLIEYEVRLLVIWTGRLLGRAAIDASTALSAAARLVMTVSRRWMESTVAGLALLIGTAEVAVLACALFSSYLNSGVFLNGIGSLGLAVLVAGALIVVWWVLTKRDFDEVGRSALHTIEGAGPTLFLTLVALGWIDGVAGLAGLGPIRPGWLTFCGTAILIASAVYLYVKERRRKPQPRESGSAA